MLAKIYKQMIKDKNCCKFQYKIPMIFNTKFL